jgi:dienelactone hydrolase
MQCNERIALMFPRHWLWSIAAAAVFVASPGAAEEADQSAEAWAKIAPYFSPPAEFAGDTGGYSSPLKFYDGRTVQSAEQWPQRRAEILREWHKMLGPWPPLVEKPKVEVLEEERRENLTQQHVQVQVALGGKQSDGYLLIPDGKGPFPAVLVVFYEAKTSIGRGMTGEGVLDFGLQLARRGFVTLSIGTPNSQDENKETRDALVQSGSEYPSQPLSFLAYAAANCHTVLAQRADVDPERIGIIGHSYGGKWTMFASCLYDKFACAVWCDPGIVFDESNSNVNYYEPWYIGFEPGVTRPRGRPSANSPRTGLYKKLFDEGRDLNELHALMPPRPFLVSGGSEDKPVRWKVLQQTIAVNKLLGQENRVAMTNREGHRPTPEALEQINAFFVHFLKPAAPAAGK